MKSKLVYVLSVVGLLTMGCVHREDKATSTADSLKAELEMSRELAQVMVDVGTMIDTIDANRKAIHVRMTEGNYRSYVARLRDINEYIKRTQDRLQALEKTAKKAKTADAYASAIKKLKSELETRNHEVAALNEEIQLYKAQNDDLSKLAGSRQAELEEKLAALERSKEETAKLEDQVKSLLVKSKLDEGESYFARAVAVEETANRTHFAPKKKKNTMKQALELYRQAQFFGKPEAEVKVAELEKRMGKSFLL